MTTKDQAIAKEVCEMCEYIKSARQNWHPSYTHDRINGPGHTCKSRPAIEAKPAPDCRTCEHYRAGPALHGDKCLKSFTGCTNGDNYVEAPAVVLWRTE